MLTSAKHKYRVLEGVPDDEYAIQPERKHCKWLSMAVISGCAAFLWILTVLLVYWYALTKIETAQRLCGQLIYSPAQEAIEYEVRVFSRGNDKGHTEYYGQPDDLNNRLWRELWAVGGGQGITRQQALRLSNRTSTIPPKWPDLYYTDIDVFHQLHCLDHIRHALANDSHYLHSSSLLGEGHVYHCFEALRESLMCHSDVSTIVRQWDPDVQEMKVRGDVAHTCRNFWKIHDWAKDHAIGAGWDDKHDWDDWETGKGELAVQTR